MRKMRPYQREGYADIWQAWSQHDVLMFVLATGGGKTFTFTEVIREFLRQGMRGMLIAHRTELINQAWQTLYDAQILSGVIKSDHPAHYDRSVQVCSIQTIARRKQLPPADFIVIDEAHHVQDDNSYGKILGMFPSAKVLMVTATPYRLSGNGFKFVVKEKETQLIVNRTLAELIDEGWLVPLQYHIGSIPDLSKVGTSKGDYDEEGLQKAMEMAPLVESYLHHCRGMQGLCFTVNKAHNKEVTKQYNDAGIPAVYVDDETTDEDRKRILADFKSRRVLIVCNVGIFTEGTDFPGCQFVQLAAPSKSLSKILQEIGRVTRALPGVVDQYDTAEERRAAIMYSQKPFGIVLDNAGTWIDHGFADEPIDWKQYFEGWQKPKKLKPEEEPEFIEIPIFEICNPDGSGKRKTSIPKEVEGMVLVKITKEMRINLRAMKHVQEFERCLEWGINTPKIDKPGYYAYFRFRKHCDTKGIDIPETVWQHLNKRLVIEVEERISDYLRENVKAGRTTIPSINARVAEMRKEGVHTYFLKREKASYLAGVRYMEEAEDTATITDISKPF